MMSSIAKTDLFPNPFLPTFTTLASIENLMKRAAINMNTVNDDVLDRRQWSLLRWAQACLQSRGRAPSECAAATRTFRTFPAAFLRLKSRAAVLLWHGPGVKSKSARWLKVKKAL